ncbi:MAG: hypothetical protein J1F06_04095 [Prevotellaceae bacterium]|nr:hypothetical protein [Prevotellaceae bacterium]
MTNLYSGQGIQVFLTGSGPFNLATAGEYVPTQADEAGENGYTLRGKSGNSDGLWICILDNGNDTNILGVASSVDAASVFQFFEITTQDEDAISDKEPEPGFYFIRTLSYGLYGVTDPYVAENGGAMKLIAGADEQNAPEALWEIIKPDMSDVSAYAPEADGTAFQIKSAVTGKYWTVGGDAPLGTNACYYNIQRDTDTGHYTFHGYSNNSVEGAITNKGNVYPTSATAFGRSNDQGIKMYYKLVRCEALPVTYNYVTSDGTALTSIVKLHPLHSSTQPDDLDFYTVSSWEPRTFESAEENTVTVTCTPNFPMEFGKYYRIQLRPGGSPANYDMIYERTSDAFSGAETDAPVNTRNNNNVNDFSLERLWYFEKVGDYPLSIILHNAAVGESRGVTASTTNNAKCTFTQTPTTFQVVTNSSTGGNGFSLRHPASANGHINDVEGHLGIWIENRSQNDLGSLFKLTPAEITAKDIRSLSTYGEPNSDILGAYFTLDEAKKETAAQDPSFENIQALLTPTFAGSVDTNRYYTVNFRRAWSGNSAMTLTGYAEANGVVNDYDNNDGETTRIVEMQPQSAASVSQLWKFVPAEGGYMIQNANCPTHYIGTPQSSNTHVTSGQQWAAKVSPEARSVHNAGNDYKGITWVLGYNNGNNHFNASNQSTNILQYRNGFNDPGNIVEIRSVDSVPVTVGATGWATLCLPFAAEIPEGVTAYVATGTSETDGTQYVMLKSIEGTIPAGTGVIIEAAAETYSFAIAADGGTVDGNLLTGVTLRRQGYEESSHYGLKASGGGAVLALNSSANVPANKSVLPVESVPATTAGALRLGRPGELTGIANAAAQPAGSVAFYNLDGQRVLRPTTGIYVTGDGRKVFVK